MRGGAVVRVLAPLVALALAGCGEQTEVERYDAVATSEDTSPTPAEPTATIAASEQPAPEPVAGPVDPVAFSAGQTTAHERLRTARIRVRYDDHGTTKTGSGVVDFRTDPRSTRMRWLVGGSVRDVVMVPRGLYLREDGRGWIRTEPTSPLVAGVPGLDVRPLLAPFGLDARSVTKVGRERLGQIRTVHYRLELDARTDTNTGYASPVGEADVWLDRRGRTVRMRMVDGVVELDVRFSDFGTPVRIGAPPKRSVLGEL